MTQTVRVNLALQSHLDMGIMALYLLGRPSGAGMNQTGLPQGAESRGPGSR